MYSELFSWLNPPAAIDSRADHASVPQVGVGNAGGVDGFVGDIELRIENRFAVGDRNDLRNAKRPGWNVVGLNAQSGR